MIEIPEEIEMVVEYAKELKKHYFPKGTTDGKCLEASHELIDHFVFHKQICCILQFGYFNGMRHCWAEVNITGMGQIFIIDITADQFDDTINGVLVGNPDDLPQYEYEME